MYELLTYYPATNELSVESNSNDDVGKVRVKLWFTMKDYPLINAVSVDFEILINECEYTSVTPIDQVIYYALEDPA